MTHPPPWDPRTTVTRGPGRWPVPPPQPPPRPGGTFPAPGPPPGPGPYRPASWGQRALARLLDSLFVSIPLGTVLFFAWLFWLFFAVLAGRTLEGADTGAMIFASVCGFLVCTAYDAVCLRVWGRTPGKMIVKIVVVPDPAPGRPERIPLDAVMVRAALYWLPLLVMWTPLWVQVLVNGVWLVPIALWPLWDLPKRQAVHDKIVRTVVLRRD
ncbi:RDD family protein [Thermobifida cellulosilytica]|uniref:RDD family protein n=1 Tax=Thermobifida cellulosilytica TaxID=144786 RepID=UPI0009FC6278|nr:RDD family protein [Thermobifida cellulosilytica]